MTQTPVKHTCFVCRKVKVDAYGEWYTLEPLKTWLTGGTRWICFACWRKE